ncbi:serine/threonine-protein kinase [uncultured Thiohalocapsa sp.]|uniref:serine/threonine-protein kinase n=1 Tax=uncultured Thiohalocapsa sp. TaxID=768990 RepID=UPI0025DEBBC8|nr:serine/threonine-protein kinase [uncultured Thiohalocapsa sp.]
MTHRAFANLCPACFRNTGSASPCTHCGFDTHTPRPANALPAGSLVNGHLIIGRVLGKPGGFGITYLGLDQGLRTRVAVKEYLPRDLVTRGPDRTTILPHSRDDAGLFRYGLKQFLIEAQTLAQLDHPNIVRVRQFFEANGSAYLLMDYYRGLTLEDYLAHQPDERMPEPKALALMQPILDGLRAVHAQGFLHRDIKPANIYLARMEGGGARPILLDFGAARQAVGERSRSLSVVLTAGYAPFEQYSRRGRQGAWTDVYAAAAVLYRMVTGRAPAEAAERLPDDTLIPAAQLGVSRPVSAALALGLAVRAEDRPQTVEDLRRLLRDAGHGVSPAPPARYTAPAGLSAAAGQGADLALADPPPPGPAQQPVSALAGPHPSLPQAQVVQRVDPYAPPAADLVGGGSGAAVRLRREYLSHEASVRSVRLLYYLGGGLMVLTALMMLMAGAVDGEGAGVVAALFFGALAMLDFYIASGIDQLRPWARNVATIFSVIGLLSFPVGTLLNGYILYLFYSDKGQCVFSERYRRAVAATPQIKYETPLLVKVIGALLLGVLILGIIAAALA